MRDLFDTLRISHVYSLDSIHTVPCFCGSFIWSVQDSHGMNAEYKNHNLCIITYCIANYHCGKRTFYNQINSVTWLNAKYFTMNVSNCRLKYLVSLRELCVEWYRLRSSHPEYPRHLAHCPCLDGTTTKLC